MFYKDKEKDFLGRLSYICFYLAVMIEVIVVLIDKSAYINPIEGILFRITFLLCFAKVCLTKYSVKEYVVMALFLGLGAISYFATERNEIVRIVMFIAACKNVDMQKCLKMVFYMTLAGCLAIITLSLFGFGGDIALTQDYGRNGVETRYTLGMGHPNALHCMFWALTVLGLYLYGEKIKWYGYFVIAGLNVSLFLLTDSKTGFLMTLFSVVYTAVIYLGKSNSFKKFCSIASILVTAASIGLSVICAAGAYHVYNYWWSIDKGFIPTLFVKIDKILTERIHELVGTVRWEGTTRTWTLFSEPRNNYYFDMGWVRLFYWYGIIPACVFIIVLFVVLWYCYKKKKYAAIMMIVSFAIYTIVEAHAVSVYLARNYVLFLIGSCWSAIVCGEKNENSIC